MSDYFDNICKAMELLAQDKHTIFMGQAVAYPGTGMFNTLHGVPFKKRLELPVFEDCQLGMAIGMSLSGLIPVCIYPRINFLLLAMNQLVLHLDAIPRYSDYRPHVIIRTAIATDKPLDPGPQHLGDFIEPIEYMLKTVKVATLNYVEDIMPTYKEALADDTASWLIIERSELY
jgi:pyruvate/2-oxoglutarate/acetoin dehydrogenase E1 component